MHITMRNINLAKAQALLNYINRIYNGKFNDIRLTVVNDETQYSYYYTPGQYTISNPTIKIGRSIDNEFDNFIIEYYNREFNMNLPNTYNIRFIQEFCHECGHHYNIDYFKNRDYEYAMQLARLDDYGYDSHAKRIAYRKIDEEYAADVFASNMMKFHLNEMLAILEQ